MRPSSFKMSVALSTVEPATLSSWVMSRLDGIRRPAGSSPDRMLSRSWLAICLWIGISLPRSIFTQPA